MTRTQSSTHRFRGPVFAPLAVAVGLSLIAACTSSGPSASTSVESSAAPAVALTTTPGTESSLPAQPAATTADPVEPAPETEPAAAAESEPAGETEPATAGETKPETASETEPATASETEPEPTPPPALDPPPLWPAGATVKRGDKGAVVLALQRRLSQLRYDPGRQDSVLGMQTRQALWAFQHVNNLPATGEVDAATGAALAAPAMPAVLAADPAPDRVEVNIAKQYAVVYLQGNIRLITHISSGSGRRWCEKDLTGALRCASGHTPRGQFKVRAELHAWRTSYLGKLYKPAYFKGGYALHGSLSVPNRAASHGCVRIPMHVAEYLVDLTEIGMPVTVA